MLTELMCKQAKPQDKVYTLSDGRGLMLSVYPNGGKYWILRYFVQGKEKRTSLGTLAGISLKEARDKAYEFKRNLASPTPVSSKPCTFAEIAEEWVKVRILPDKAKTYIESIEQRLKNHILPAIGHKPLTEITPSVVLALCRKIEALGIVETAMRCKQVIGQVFKYAIATDRADTEPTSALAGALQSRKNRRHLASLTNPTRIAILMRQIREYPFVIVRHALLLSIFTFCRPGEIRHAEWEEIDLDRAEWKIPSEKMKMKRPHIVPLSSQCVQVLSILKPLTSGQKWLFPSSRRDGRPMSENTVSTALRMMGFSREEMTAHGFRGMASTILNENSFSPDVIERQLAHIEGNKIRAAYNHAEYLAERRKMMQWWADWLDNQANSPD